MKRSLILAAVVAVWLALAGTALCQESLDALDTRLESERLSIESDRQALNQDCKHVPESDTLLMEVCGKLQKSVMERMAKWKQESARLQTLRCADLSERLKRWETGALRAAQVIRKNDALIAEAKDDRRDGVQDAGKTAAQFGRSVLWQKITDAAESMKASKAALDASLAVRRVVSTGESLEPPSGSDFEESHRDASALSKRAGHIITLLYDYRAACDQDDKGSQEKLRLTLREETERFRSELAVKVPDAAEAVGSKMTEMLGGPGGKLAFEGTAAGIKLFTGTAEMGVDNLELRMLKQSQETLGRELMKAQEQIRSLRTQIQTHGCS